MPNERPTALRFFAPDHPKLADSMRAKLESRRDELLEQLLMPLPHDDYNRRAGAILGLDEAIQMCIDTELELRQRDR